MKSEIKKLALILTACLSSLARGGELQVTVRDLHGNPLQDAVVYAEKLGETAKAPTQHPIATIDQVNRQFVPLVSVIRTGTEVSFPNSDGIRHSIYSFSPAKTFTIKLYSGKQAPPVVFDKPGIVVLGCNIHDPMVAWIVVVDTPFFGMSGLDGKVVLRTLDPGEYRLNVWYPTGRSDPVASTLRIEAGVIERDVQIDTADSPLPALKAHVLSKSRTQP